MTFKAKLIALTVILATCLCTAGCLTLWHKSHGDITSECVDVESESNSFELTADYSAVDLSGPRRWVILTPSKYIGETPPEDEPRAHMFPHSKVIREVKAGTRFRILKVDKGTDEWGHPGEGFHLCTMTVELGTPDKFVCEMPSDSFDIRPFRFYSEFAKPVEPAK